MKATDPTIIFISEAFKYFLMFVIVWTILFFMALPIGMGKEEQMGRASDVKKKALYSALISAVISGIIYWALK